MKMVFILLFAALLSGCATVSPGNSLDDGSEGIKWSHLASSGISEDAHMNIFTTTVTPEGRTGFFTTDTEKVTWWGLAKLWAFFMPPRLLAKWYQPNGELFWEEEFSYDNNALFIKVSLPIKNAPARDLPGIWRVEIYYQDRVIDREKFHITGTDSVATAAPSAITGTAANAPTATDIFPEASGMDEDILKHYNQARLYYKNGMYEEARRHLNAILQKDPDQIEVHWVLASISFRQTRWDECLEELDYVIRNPKYEDRVLRTRNMVLDMKKAEAARTQ
ncbi:MAG: tetratricopeptide repeat protein [Candidatus Omnitrophica bacterium]|nr:tetratricopeptide repeat protein [Candidatus Omnitrophota bacterium]